VPSPGRRSWLDPFFCPSRRHPNWNFGHQEVVASPLPHRPATTRIPPNPPVLISCRIAFWFLFPSLWFSYWFDRNQRLPAALLLAQDRGLSLALLSFFTFSAVWRFVSPFVRSVVLRFEQCPFHFSEAKPSTFSRPPGQFNLLCLPPLVLDPHSDVLFTAPPVFFFFFEREHDICGGSSIFPSGGRPMHFNSSSFF